MLPSINSYTQSLKKDKVNTWSQEIHAIMPYIDFKHIKGNENMLSDSLSRLKCLGLYEDNDPEKTRCEYCKSIDDNEVEAICDVDISQNTDLDKYHIDEKRSK